MLITIYTVNFPCGEETGVPGENPGLSLDRYNSFHDMRIELKGAFSDDCGIIARNEIR